MSTYAGIVGGVVTRIIAPSVAISFLSGPGITWVDVAAVSPQPVIGSAAGQAASGLWSFAAPTLTPAQQAYALIAGGLAVTSTSTPAVNGTYAVNSSAQNHISAEMLCILATQGFAGGGTSTSWALANGTTVTFPSLAVFQDFAIAVGSFVAGCQKVIDGVTGATLPSASVTIA